jgi:hypothetical protein
VSEAQHGGERNEILSFPWPYRRIATEEAFSLPEVYEAMRGWAATADPAEPDQDFWDFVCTEDTPGLHRVRRQLLDLEDERLEIMDANGVDVQLLSLTAPGVQNWAPVLRFCIEAVGADNIMFAIDYPYQTAEGAVRFLDEAEISDEDRRKIYHRNAERIFGIPDGDEPA